MASIITGATRAAHSTVATILSATQIQTGEQIHTKPVKEDDPVKHVTLDLAGKNIIVSQMQLYKRGFYASSRYTFDAGILFVGWHPRRVYAHL